MGLRDPLPGWVAWITRTIGYSAGAIAIAIAWFVTGNLRLGHHYIDCIEKPQSPNPTAMQSAKSLVACVDAKAGIVEALAFWRTRRLFAALPSAPCDYVGRWHSSRNNSLYEITLARNSQFLAKPLKTPDGDKTLVTGSWGVVGGKMVWLYDIGFTWPPDVNPITHTSAGFSLTEANGGRTDFTRVDAGGCTPVELPRRLTSRRRQP